MRAPPGQDKRLVCTLALAVLLLPVGVHAAEVSESLARAVLYSDLIVRGVIVSVTAETVPWDSLFVPTHEGKQAAVTLIEVEVDDVLKGSWSDRTVRAFIPGNPAIGGFIMEVTYDYVAGDEVILCLHYDAKIMGGSVRVWGDEESFVKRGNTWVSRGRFGRKVSLHSIESQVRMTDPENMVGRADAVVLGSIIAVNRRKFDCGFEVPCTADYTAVRVTQAWKGASAGDELLVRVLRRGTNLSWYSPVPPLAVGQTCLMFLSRDEEGFYPLAGFNGFLQVDGDRLIMNGHILYPISTPRMLATIGEATAR